MDAVDAASVGKHKMRILIIALVQYPPTLGGGTRLVHRLATHLHKQGHSIQVISLSQSDDSTFDKEQFYPTLRVGKNPKPGMYRRMSRAWNRFSYVLAMRHQILQFSPDVILCAEWHPCGQIGWLMSLLPGTRRIPYCVLALGTEVITLPGTGLLRIIMRAHRLRVYRRARQIIAISHYTKDRVAELGIKSDSIVIVPPGIDETDLAASIQHERVHDSPVLLTVGRLVQRKGFDVVIRALPLLINEYPNLQYIIVGEGPERARIKALASTLGVTERVILHGQVSEEEKWDLYDHSDLFVLPAHIRATNFEGFGIVYLEAMGRGLPVIGAATGGVVDIIEDNVTGLLVPPNDPQALARAIERMLSDATLRRRVIATAYERVSSSFTWEVVTRKYVESLSEVIGGKVERA